MADEIDQSEMLVTDAPKGKRGRPARADTERAERRRRGGGTVEESALAIPDETKRELAEKGLETRWINDLGNRMYQKTQLDDWNKVEGIEPVPVGTDSRTGKPVMAHLCAKPKAFLEEDNARRMKQWDERERQSLAGRDPAAQIEGEYQPMGSTNTVRRS